MMVPVLILSAILALCNGIHSKNDEDIDNVDTFPKMPPTSQGDFINVGTPGGVSLSFDCAVRKYAYEYGQQIIPRAGEFVDLFDSLQLAACNMTRPIPKKRSPPKYDTNQVGGTYYYVDGTNGSDDNDGSENAPFKTIEKAVAATRTARAKEDGKLGHINNPCVISIMEGTYYMSDTIELAAADSYLTFQNYNGQKVTISGGVPLNFTGEWKLEQYEKTKWRKYENANNVYGRADKSASNDQVEYLGVYGSYDACLNASLASGQAPFYSITYHDMSFNGYPGHCYGMKDMHWAPVQEDNITSGYYEGRNIWSVQIENTDDLLDGKIYGLRVNGKRAIRARYPNQNPETMMQYAPLSGWISAATEWMPPTQMPDAKDIKQDASDWPGVIWPMDPPGNTTWTGEGDWGLFFQGKGGHCTNMEPDYGYWCAHDAPRHITQHESPSGVVLDPTNLINAPYSDVSDAVIHSWRPSHWYTWMWTAGDYDADTGKLEFADGGFQGGEGETTGAEWYIENVQEELDSPNEYFYNSTTNTLYFYYNVTEQRPPPSDVLFVAVKTKVLFNITGTQASPVQNITFQGLEFRDTPYTYMDKHGLPSGGDWALQRQGAITFEGSEDCRVNECVFTRIDGIGIFLSGYNRYAVFENNDFSWIGDSAMAAWGYTSGADGELPGGGPDGREGNQPRFTTIQNNVVRELGIWEKQSSMWFQATSAQTRILNNVFFNGPRAAVNVNDGFGGDNHMIGNLLMNTCRESGDHGPWNSWDRVPYITRIGNGTSSIIPAYQQIHNNFIIGTYQTQEGIDTDDGSSYYNTTGNFFVYGDYGLKNDFGGHDNRHVDNLYAYIGAAWTFCCLSGQDDHFTNNSVVLRGNGGYTSNCNLPPGTNGMIIRDNTIYNPSGSINGNGNICGVTFQEWQILGNDPGTKFYPTPSDDEIIKMAKAKLQNN